MEGRRTYAALMAFTGGLIGPPNASLHHGGSLADTPALFSSGDPDPHVPWQRVEESARELEPMGVQVQLIRHPDRPHTILQTEIDTARGIILHQLRPNGFGSPDWPNRSKICE